MTSLTAQVSAALRQSPWCWICQVTSELRTVKQKHERDLHRCRRVYRVSGRSRVTDRKASCGLLQLLHDRFAHPISTGGVLSGDEQTVFHDIRRERHPRFAVPGSPLSHLSILIQGSIRNRDIRIRRGR